VSGYGVPSVGTEFHFEFSLIFGRFSSIFSPAPHATAHRPLPNSFRKTTGTVFEINKTAFDEVRGTMWYGRLRPKAKSGGGSIE